MKGLKAVLASVLIISLFTRCEEDIKLEPGFLKTMEKVDVEEEEQLLAGLDLLPDYSSHGRVASVNFGTLQYEEAYKSILKEGQTKPNYMIRILPPEDVLYSLEYLVLIGVEHGFRGYILQYQTEEAFVHTINNIDSLTGYVRLLDFNRQVRAENYFVNGVEQESSDSDNLRIKDEYVNCDCEYIWEMVDVGYDPSNNSGFVGEYRIVGIECECDNGSTGGGGSGGDWGGGGHGSFLPTDDGQIGGGGGGGGGYPDPVDNPDNPNTGLTLDLVGSKKNTDVCLNGTYMNEKGECLTLSALAKNWENDKITLTDAFKNDPCIMDIYNTMSELSVGYETLQNYIGGTPVAKLIFDIQDLSEGNNEGSNGISFVSGTYSNASVTITLNSKKLDRSKLSIARTLLHEMIHAELHGMVIEAGGYDHLQNFAVNYQGDDPFLMIWEYYQEHGKYVADENPGWQHEYMADNYIKYIAEGLKKLHPELSSQRFIDYVGEKDVFGSPWNWDDFFTALAWDGLKGVTNKDGIFIKYTESYQKDVIDKGLQNIYNFYSQDATLESSTNKCQ